MDKEIVALKMLEASAEKEGLENIETIFSDYHTWLPEKSVDHVLLIGVLPYITERVLLLEELFRVMKPGGVLTTRHCHRISKSEVIDLFNSSRLFHYAGDNGNLMYYSPSPSK